MNLPVPSSTSSKLAQTLRSRVVAAPAGRVFSPADFADLGNRAAVDQALSRLAKSGVLRRISRGLYDRPQDHPLFGTMLPSADEIAKALASKGALRLQPSGAYAANLLGLSEQVPMKLVFLTDGASRNLQIGEQQIVLRRTTPRNMATAGRISGLVIQALRYMKQKNVDDDLLVRLQRRLTFEDKASLLSDVPLAPAWIGKIMQRLAQDEYSLSGEK